MTRRLLLALALVGLALVTGACSASPEVTNTTATTTSTTTPAISTIVTTTQPIVAVDASFAIGVVVFGDQGWIDVVNTGSQPGNVHGFWVAIHPFYLELPSTIVEVGEAVTVTLDPGADPDVAILAAGLLPVLAASGGEVALYSNGNFGNPKAIVDYVEWGSGGHFRSTVAEAAGIWEAGQIVPMTGDEGGLIVGEGVPQPLDADLLPTSPQG